VLRFSFDSAAGGISTSRRNPSLLQDDAQNPGAQASLIAYPAEPGYECAAFRRLLIWHPITIQVKPYVAGAGRGLDWSRSGELVIGMVGVGRREVLTLADGRRYEECGGDFWGAVGG